MKKTLSIIGLLLIAVFATAAFGGDLSVTHHPLALLGQHGDVLGAMPALMGIGMTTLAADAPREYYEGKIQELPVIANDIIYQGAAVGDNASGYMRPLVAGDPFRGFAEVKVDNTGGAAGDKYVRLLPKGRVKLAISALAITDVGKDVYASDDDTFTLTQGSNTRIGHVTRWISTGYGVVEFDATSGVVTELTDSTGGTPGDTLAAATNIDTLTDSTGGTANTTLAAVGATNSGDVSGDINNNFADLAAQHAKQKALNTVLINAVASLSAKVNYLIRRQGN